MAAGADAEKTEEPTPKRLREARQRGQVARSVDLTNALGLLACTLVLASSAAAWMGQLQEMLRQGLLALPQAQTLDVSTIWAWGGWALLAGVRLLAPVMVVALAVGLIAGATQTRFLFTLQALRPNFGRLNPIEGTKRLFSLNGAVELLKSLFKLAVISAVAWLIVAPRITELGSYTGLSAAQVLALTARWVLSLTYAVGLVFLLMGLFDFLYQRYSTNKQLKMSRDEVRQEMRQSEGSPEVRAQIKQRQRAAAQARMMTDVPSADVVVTNPSHYAVALAYDPNQSAPRVLAKGVDGMAARIRERAQEAGVPLVANAPLARSLHALCEVGEMIPESLYVAVAEVLSYVYALDTPQAGAAGRR